MSKAVMMSIQPKWVEKILNGEKTIDVRKTRPKLETPFKVYVYCTKTKNKLGFGTDKIFKGINNKVGHGEDFFWNNYHARKGYEGHDIVKLNGKVVAEFTCNTIFQFHKGIYHNEEEQKCICSNTCLTFEEIEKYAGNKKVYYEWGISDLKIYDKPRELGEFHKKLPCHVQGDYNKLACWECCEFYDRGECDGSGEEPLTRPPQSWCYVEEI